MSKFTDRYKKQDCQRIELEDVVFHVDLPTSANRRYERAVAASMSKLDRETGEFVVSDFDLVDMFDAQHRAFLKACIIRVEGLEFDPATFYDDYPEATEELFKKAVELATEQEVEALESAGKSEDTSSGQTSGKVKKSSTPECLKAAG